MTIQAMRLAKKTKTFHRNSFRKVINLLIISLGLNCILAFAIYSKFVSLPEPTYYATSGITAPIRLAARDKRNYSSIPLLKSDQGANDSVGMMSYGN